MTEPTPDRRRSRLGIAGFAALAYVPVLLTDPGKVVADTKSYLYLDAGKFLAGAGSMWDPSIGMGTVSHQTIGYLFPLGPFYWLLETVLRVPPWIAERLWLGSLIFAAGLGVRYLMRTLGQRGPAVGVAMLAYALSPYALELSSRLSVLLGPWSGLPWMLAFTVLAVRERSWRYAAAFALTVQLVGGVNTSSLLFAGIGPLLWLPFAVFVLRETHARDAVATAARIGVLTLVTSLWWISGLWVQGKFGLDILRFTESMRAVSSTGTPIEALRGLGYWFFYGQERSGVFWNDGAAHFTTNLVALGLSLVIPFLAMVAAALVRWRYRAFFVLLVVVGVIVAVGASPYEDPSALGGAFKSFAATSTAGFAMRSTARAVPLVALGVAVLLGIGSAVVADRLRALRPAWPQLLVPVLVAALVLANAPGVWNGLYYTKDLERSAVPQAYRDAAAALDREPHSTRVLALPGADFAAYTWGNTIDPIEPGLLNRPFVARELVPWGSEATANLLQAVDHRVQENSLDAASLPAVARLMRVGDVWLRFDLQSGRFGLLQPTTLLQMFQPTPSGIGVVKPYGKRVSGLPQVATMTIEDARPIVDTKSARDPVVLVGDGEGVVDAASAQLLDGQRLVQYWASRTASTRVPPGALIVVTDSNRRRAERWTGLRSIFGFTETAGEQPLKTDPLDQRLDVFSGNATDADRTVTEFGPDVQAIRATTYGTQGFAYTPSLRPAAAMDGDPKTAWETGADRANPVGDRLVVDLTHSITTDHLDLVQAFANVDRTRWITNVRLRFDGGHAVDVRLGEQSRDERGQRIAFASRTFRRVEVEVTRVSENRGRVRSSIGIAEVRLSDGSRPVRATETLRVPDAGLDTLDSAASARAIAYVFTPNVTDIRDRFRVARNRTFAIAGSLVLARDATDATIDRTLGRPDASAGGITAESSSRVQNSFAARASSALDGRIGTAWVPSPTDDQPWIRVTLPKPERVDHLDLQLLDGPLSSLPTQLRIDADTGEHRVVDLPAIANAARAGSTRAVPLQFAALTGKQFTVTITRRRDVSVPDGHGGAAVTPIGIAELGLAEAAVAAEIPEQIASECRDDLVAIDGQPVPVRIHGSRDAMLSQRPVAFDGCGAPTTAPTALRAGWHIATARSSAVTHGITTTRLVLSSDWHGVSEPAGAIAGAGNAVAGPRVRVESSTRSSTRVRVDGATTPYWLVLGQSISAGWHATVGGHDLGAPTLVDGFANGWRIDPARVGSGAITVDLDFAPQKVVGYATWFSAAGAVLCAGLLVLRRRRPVAIDRDDRAATEQYSGVAMPLATAAVGAFVVGLAAGVTARWWVGGVVAVATFAAARVPRVRRALAIAPFAVLAIVALGIVIVQHRDSVPAGLAWAAHFESWRSWTWLAVWLLVAREALAVLGTRRADALEEAVHSGAGPTIVDRP